jgi:putative endonuclease
MYFVYVLQNKVNKHLYKGISNNLERRIKEHNQGKHKSTAPYIPWEIVYFEEYETFEEARKRELFLKSGSGRELLRNLLVK